MNERWYVGSAGWAVRGLGDLPASGSQLERYATRFNAVEINSSFKKPHRRATYERWASSVPRDFRFSVKMPRAVTHVKRLVGCEEDLDQFLSAAQGLGEKLGPILVQLPPSFSYPADPAPKFFELLRERFDGEVVLEARHATWFASQAIDLLASFQIALVEADPTPVSGRGWENTEHASLRYLRLHGSPRMYYSSYSSDYLDRVAQRVSDGTATWCIFDNTAAGAAIENAAELLKLIAHREATVTVRR